MIRITTPLTKEKVKDLNVGDSVLISGTIYIGRDAAHKRMVETLTKKEDLPFNPKGAVIYYAGPAPAKHNQIINSVGPTSSYRMDPFSEDLVDVGVTGMIGKGPRSAEFREMIVKKEATYFVCVGGAAALIAQSIKKQEIIAYEDLGAEALRKVEVIDFPCIVAYDSKGKSIIK